MSTDTAGERPSSLRAAVAEEVRVLLVRRRMSAIELGRRLGKSHTFVGRRLNGETAFDLDDLEQIAGILGVNAADIVAAARVESPSAYRNEEIRGRMHGPGEGYGDRMPAPSLPEIVPDRPSGRRDQARPTGRRPPAGPGRTARIYPA